LLAILSAYAVPQTSLADDSENINIDKIEVISTTPLKGVASL